MSRHQPQHLSPPIYQLNPYNSTTSTTGTTASTSTSDNHNHFHDRNTDPLTLLSPPAPLQSARESQLSSISASSSTTSAVPQPPRLPSLSLFQPPPPREDTGYRLESRGRIPALLIHPVPYRKDSQGNNVKVLPQHTVDTPTQTYAHATSPYEQPLLPPLSGGPSSSSNSRLLGFNQPSSSSSQSHSHSRSPYSSHFFHLALSNPLSASSTVSPGDRVLRSPHPPLTAVHHPSSHLWPPSLPPIGSSSHTFNHSHSHSQSGSPHDPPATSIPRPYYTAPASGEIPSVPGPSQYRGSSHHQAYTQKQPHSDYVSTSSYLPPVHEQHSQTQGYSSDPSLFHIPPPLRFKYSASPPAQFDNMPPRKKATAGTSTTGAHSSDATQSITPHTVSSTTGIGSGSRGSRKAVPNGNAKGWTMEHTYDSVGQRKEVIVIDDSASPLIQHPIRKRTRAQVAAEQQAQAQAQAQAQGLYNGSGTSHPSNGHGASASLSASTKRRKVDEASEAGSVKKAKGKVASTATSASVQVTGGTRLQQPAVQPKVAQYQKPAPASSQSSQTPAQPPWDDADGHYIVKPDDVIGGRYKIVRLLGQGTFGKVVEARHIETRQKVAIKVIRAVQKYRDASKIEIRVLETLKRHDPRNDNKCIHLEEYFDFRNHPCLVSELYGMSVFDFLKQNAFQPFPEKHIQDFAKSLLRSVAFLHQLKLVHTDLKPENILLCSNEARLVGPRSRNARSKSILRNTEIRLIDFGSATFETEYHSSVVSTRHYRAPEIILGLPWSYPCDMYSIGCILVEFYTGDALFQTHDNLEHLAMMEVVMGKFSSRMIDKGRQKKPEFFRGNKIDFPNMHVTKASRKFVKQMRNLKDIIAPTTRHQQLFLDLCVRLLEADPDVRIKVNDALRHPYLTEPIPEPA